MIYDEIKDIDGWLLPEEAEALYSLAQSHGRVILEVGTYRGKSAAALVKGAASRFRNSQFFSLDIDQWAGVRATEVLMRHRVESRAVFFLGPLSKFREQFQITPTMAFIDGDHTYEGTAADIAELSTFLRPKIPVVFHDYLNPDTLGVKRAVDEWCRNGFARQVRTFGCSVLVTTTKKCTGRWHFFSNSRFRELQPHAAKITRKPIRAMIGDAMPWLVPVVRKLGL